MLSNDLKEFRVEAHEFCWASRSPCPRRPSPGVSSAPVAMKCPKPRWWCGPCWRRSAFRGTHDHCWTVLGSPLLAQTLDEATFAVVDLETTGSVIGVDEIIEIGAGAIVRKGGEIIDRFETLVWTDRTIPPWVARLTGISNDDLEGAPDLLGRGRGPGPADRRQRLRRPRHPFRPALPALGIRAPRAGRPAVTGLCTLQLSAAALARPASRSLPDLAAQFGDRPREPAPGRGRRRGHRRRPAAGPGRRRARPGAGRSGRSLPGRGDPRRPAMGEDCPRRRRRRILTPFPLRESDSGPVFFLTLRVQIESDSASV